MNNNSRYFGESDGNVPFMPANWCKCVHITSGGEVDEETMRKIAEEAMNKGIQITEDENDNITVNINGKENQIHDTFIKSIEYDDDLNVLTFKYSDGKDDLKVSLNSNDDDVDLSGYLTKADADAMYVKKDSDGEFVTTKYLEDTLELYTTNEYANATYVRQTEYEGNAFVKQECLETLVEEKGFVKKAEVNAELADKQPKGNYLEYTLENEDRKVVQLNNNDIIGAVANEDSSLEGIIPAEGWVSLIHLNRWNVVDLGSSKTITNINTPKYERPTVQEAGQSGAEAHKIAYLDDFEDVIKYKEFAETRKTIELKNHDTISGLDTNGVGHNLAMVSKWDVADFGAVGLHMNLNSKEGKVTINDDKEVATTDIVNDCVKFEDQNGRKVITFNNADIIGALANEDELEYKYDAHGWQSLIQLNKWNVVDCGSPRALFNINIPAGKRPTVQEAGQSGPEAHEIAYLSEIKELREEIAKLKADIKALKG